MVSPRQEANPQVSSILSIDINRLNDMDLENIDVPSLVNIKGLEPINSLSDLPLDNLSSIDIGLEDYSTINPKDICAICQQHKPNEVSQLIKCTHCGKKYHTTCLKLAPIPFSTSTQIEKRKYDAYINEHYSKWSCPNCKHKDISPSSVHSSTPVSPGSLSPGSMSPKRPRPFIGSIPLIKSPAGGLSPSSPKSPGVKPIFPGLNPSASGMVSPSPLSSPRSAQPILSKVIGTDLSQGGVIVGTSDYLKLQQQQQQQQQQQLEKEKVSEGSPLPIPRLESQLVPIFTDSETSSEDESTPAPKHEKKKHIKTEKLKKFLQQLLSLPNDKSSYDDFIMKVANLVKQNDHPSDLDSVYAVPVFLLRSMLQTAAISPSSIPLSGISKIDGKEVTRIADHPKLKAFFDRLQNKENAEDIKKDMVAAGLDGSLLEKDPNTVVLLDNFNVSYVQFERAPLSNKAADETKTSIIRLKVSDHPLFRKYFNMLMRNIPRADVENSMKSCGLDPSLLDKPNELIEYVPPPPPPPPLIPIQSEVSAPTPSTITSVEPAKGVSTKKKVKLCEHPVYSKYFNMLKKGVPKVAVCHAMRRDKVDESIIDKDPNEEIEIEIEEKPEEKPKEEKKKVKLSEHPIYSKYFNMLKKGVPKVAVCHAMRRDKVDESIIDKDPNEEIEIEEEKPKEEKKKVKLCEHPIYSKYFNMLKKAIETLMKKSKLKRNLKRNLKKNLL